VRPGFGPPEDELAASLFPSQCNMLNLVARRMAPRSGEWKRMRTCASWIVLISFWIVFAGLFTASGIAFRAAVRRRLVLGSRLFIWREPMRVVEGAEAVRVSLTFLAIILVLALFFLELAVRMTWLVVGASARLN
jgi:hypothetical protein